MKKFFNERGVVAGYLVGVVVLAVILIGGVMLLKNIGGNQSANKPVAVQPAKTSDEKKDETKTSENDDKTTATVDSSKITTTTEATTSTVATTGPTSESEYTPENLTATGPVEDTLTLVFGLLVIMGAIYATWNYQTSRKMVKTALLQK